MGAFDDLVCERTDCVRYPELAVLLGHDPEGHRVLTAVRIRGITTVRGLALASVSTIKRLGPTGVDRVRERLRAAGIGPERVAEWEASAGVPAEGVDEVSAAAEALEYAEGLQAGEVLDVPLADLIARAWMSGYRCAVGGGAARL